MLLAAYPFLLWIHILSISAWIGAMSGAILAPAENLRTCKLATLTSAAITGVLLFAAKPELYSNNFWFWIKLALLAAIAVNTFTLRRASLTFVLLIAALWFARGPATIKDIMHSMVDPAGDFLFQSVQLISDQRGIREKAPQTDAEWNDVRARVEVLLDAPDLLTSPGRRAARPRDRSKNPAVESEPSEIERLLAADRPGFVLRAMKLHDAASVALKAVDAKNKDALIQALDGIDRACESCHLKFWYPHDKRAQEAAKANGIE